MSWTKVFSGSLSSYIVRERESDKNRKIGGKREKELEGGREVYGIVEIQKYRRKKERKI